MDFFQAEHNRDISHLSNTDHAPTRLISTVFSSAQTSAQTSQLNFTKRVWKILIGASLATSVILGVSSARSQELQVPPGQRWLEVRQTAGTVQYRRGEALRPARVGDRLQQVGHGIDTALMSTSVLELDTQIGAVRVAENTRLLVKTLTVLSDGGRVTALRVDRGQARLQIRRFTHPNSELEIETPAGVAAVRGTIFGVTVDEVGKTGVATLSGSVEASAQGETVIVNPGFATTIIPGEPPTEPQPIDRVLQLRTRTIRRTSGGIILSGQADPANLVQVNGQDIATRSNGQFSTFIPSSPLEPYVRVTVRNPVGDERTHEFVAR